MPKPTLKACLDCGKPTTQPRCNKHHIHPPNYNHTHRKQRAHLLPQAIGHPCPLCNQPMLNNQPLDLDHTTNTITHAHCNRRAGANLTNHGQHNGGVSATPTPPILHPANFREWEAK